MTFGVIYFWGSKNEGILEAKHRFFVSFGLSFYCLEEPIMAFISTAAFLGRAFISITERAGFSCKNSQFQAIIYAMI
jgi:hypothetical protein